MNAEKLMNAIGGISDRHILEFVIVKPVVFIKKRCAKIVLAVACLCIIVTGVVFFLNGSDQPYVNVTDIPQPGKIVWGSGFADFDANEWRYYTGQARNGTVVISENLRDEISKEENSGAVFAVLVTETRGKSQENVYESFVKPMNVKEDYMNSGVIFATAEQIASIVCPLDMAVVLSLAGEPHGGAASE